MRKVAIVAYNAGNTLSVSAALSRLGASVEVTDRLESIASASHIVFPGVGHAAPAARHLKETGIDKVLVQARQPVLGICLGMQLLCESSEEGETPGLGAFKVPCRRFGGVEKVPHMGWNTITSLRGKLFEQISDKSYVYFVHSYRVDLCDSTTAITDYEQQFSAALERDNFFGVQFHPEKSGSIGKKILENFLNLD